MQRDVDPGMITFNLFCTYSASELCLDKCFHNHTNSEKRLLTFVLCFAKIMLFVCEYKTKSFKRQKIVFELLYPGIHPLAGAN